MALKCFSSAITPQTVGFRVGLGITPHVGFMLARCSRPRGEYGINPGTGGSLGDFNIHDAPLRELTSAQTAQSLLTYKHLCGPQPCPPAELCVLVQSFRQEALVSSLTPAEVRSPLKSTSNFHVFFLF